MSRPNSRVWYEHRPSDHRAGMREHWFGRLEPMPEHHAAMLPALITVAQLTELQLLFTHLGIPVAEFLAVAKIDALDKLPANWFDRAKKWVNDAAKAKRDAMNDTLGEDQIPY